MVDNLISFIWFRYYSRLSAAKLYVNGRFKKRKVQSVANK